MGKRQLKHILSRQAILITGLPFVFLAVLVSIWFFPGIIRNTESHQIHLAQITAVKTENHLIRSMTILQGVSNYIKTCKDQSNYSRILNSQIKTSNSLKAIYVIGPDGKVIAVSLKHGSTDQEKDLSALDLSRSALYKKAKQEKMPVWSDTLLSVIGGGISVAYAVPTGDNLVMGEIDLRLLSEYLKQIATDKDQVIMVLDRRGQVIADRTGHFTAQQFNLGHLALVQEGLKQSEPVAGDFELDTLVMTGVMVKASLIDWFVLVGNPKALVYRPIKTTAMVLSMIFLGTIFIGIVLAIVLARRLSYRFDGLANHARQIATGKPTGEWPSFNIKEFKELAGDIQDMANALQEREAYNRILFADSPIPLLVIDPEPVTCVDANMAALRILGLDSHGQLEEKSVLDFSAPQQKGEINPFLAIQAHIDVALNKGFTTLEWMFQRAANDIWYGDITLCVFNYGGQQLLQMSIIDITGRKREAAMREKLEEQLRQAQKMESIGTLAGGIAHDFNNILFPVMGYTEMVLDDLDQDSPHKFHLQEVMKGCLRAKDLVQQILTFSRQAAKEDKPLQVHLIIKEILQLSRATLPTTIEIRQRVSKDAGLVMADPTQMHQVIMNLVTNAFHAMEDRGGTLIVALDDVQFSSDNLPSMNLIPGWYVCITVSDTGLGIAPEIMENIFNPYFTTKGKGKGTGLGLSVVHGIVKNYQGDILVESNPGKGSTFKVYLPRIVSDYHLHKDDDPTIDLSGTGHILLVDDEKPICFMIEQMLERLGYSVSSRNSSLDALEAFKASPDKFDLVITDMTMPNLTGDKLALEIKKIRPTMPILLCSGFSEKINQGKASEFQVDHILMKPILKKDLAQAIINILKKNK